MKSNNTHRTSPLACMYLHVEDLQLLLEGLENNVGLNTGNPDAADYIKHNLKLLKRFERRLAKLGYTNDET